MHGPRKGLAEYLIGARREQDELSRQVTSAFSTPLGADGVRYLIERAGQLYPIG
jgi:hypothetical protein